MTTSSDPAVMDALVSHVVGMIGRVEAKDSPDIFIQSPTLDIFFERGDQIETTIDVTNEGIVVKQTSEDPELVAFFPSPTRDLAEGLANLRTHGLTIFPGLLEGRSLQRARDALYRAAEEDEARGRQQAFSLDYAQDTSNRRVWNVLSRDPIFEDLAFHPDALAYVKGVLGWPALLGNLSANITGPGGGEMVLHADQIFVPEPWAPEPQGLNIAWCLDDFRESNGATRFVPGSHRLNRPPQGQEGVTEARPLEAPAGSAVIFESRVWHQTGNNRTLDEHRAGVFAWYTKPIYRPQENWFLSLRPEVREFASEEALVLLGYRAEGLGLVHGRSPA